MSASPEMAALVEEYGDACGDMETCNHADPDSIAAAEDEVGRARNAILAAIAKLDQRPLGADERGEVPTTIGGALGSFTLRRAWTYWIVSGDVPADIAARLYADPIGATDIRVDGHCGCPPPTGAVGCYHIDSEAGLRIFADAIRDLLAALPPDPAPTGERRPCAGWVTLKDSPGYKLVEVRLGGLRLAAWWSALLPMQQPVAWEVSDAQRVIAHDSAGDNIATLDAAQLAAESAAAELLRAGLRALGCK